MAGKTEDVDERRLMLARMAHRDDWIAQTEEDVIDPEREIVDPHHHLWNRGGSAYELEAWWADTSSGHNVTQTVFIECNAGYRETGHEHLRCIGETEYVARMAEASLEDESKATIAAIVPHADLRGPDLAEVLDAHAAAGKGLFRGIRHSGAFEKFSDILMIRSRSTEGLYRDDAFLRGVDALGTRGLTYDTWHYHHQNMDFRQMAEDVPGTTMILAHMGTPLGVGPYQGQRREIFARWKDDMEAIAERPNVVAKLGGMAMPDNGYGWHERRKPPGSNEFVDTQADWYLHMIKCFGPERCMFESNFPVDKVSIGYRVLWNGLKKIAEDFDDDAKTAMFSGTARRIYRL